MKTLTELNKNCTLLCEHKQPAFIINGVNESLKFRDYATICKLFTDNKGKFFFYKKITKADIQTYSTYDSAIERYINFITNTCYK